MRAKYQLFHVILYSLYVLNRLETYLTYHIIFSTFENKQINSTINFNIQEKIPQFVG